jgi:hypothetical protein
MYNAFVLPHFNYCSTIWNDGSCTIINKLSKLQRIAARVITSSTYDIRSSQILKDLNWKPIHLFTNSDAILNHDALWVIQGKNPNSKAFNVVLRHNTIIVFYKHFLEDNEAV